MTTENIINTAYENRANLSPTNIDPSIKTAIHETIDALDSGKLRAIGQSINGLKKRYCYFFVLTIIRSLMRNTHNFLTKCL
jgi:hypothetical protein